MKCPLPGAGFPVGADELTLLAACIFGEARGEPFDGQVAVAGVVIERAWRGGWFGDGIAGVILKPKQFSAFLPQAAGGQLEVLCHPLDHEAEAVWLTCWHVATGVRFGYLRTSMVGATHYVRAGVSPPWVTSLTRLGQVGKHVFFREPGGVVHPDE